MTSHNLLIDVLGWLGAVALLTAYALISARRVQGDSGSYQLLNLAGAVLLMINSAFYGAYPSAFVNVVWLVIALAALAHSLRKPATDRQ